MKYSDLNNMLGTIIKVLEEPTISPETINGVVGMLKGINITVEKEGVFPNYILETLSFPNNDEFVKFQQENIIFIHSIDIIPNDVGKVKRINIVFHRETR